MKNHQLMCTRLHLSTKVNKNMCTVCVEAVMCSDLLMSKVKGHNRRTLDMLSARCYFYHGRAYELTNQLDKLTRYA